MNGDEIAIMVGIREARIEAGRKVKRRALVAGPKYPAPAVSLAFHGPPRLESCES
jgi:hypothetical protein